MLDLILSLSLSLLFAAAFCGSGAMLLTRILRRAPEELNHPLEMLPYATALGFAIYSYLAALLLLTHAASAGIVFGTLVIGAAAGYPFWMRLAREAARLKWRTSGWTPLGLLSLLLFLLWAGVSISRAAAPVHEGDAIEGYMFTARWLLHHGFSYCPYNPRYSLFPLQTEQLIALTLSFGNDLVFKFLDLWVGFAFIGLVFLRSLRHSSTAASLLAAASLASLPVFYADWTSGKIDNIASFCLFAGFMLLIAARQSAAGVWLASFLTGTACAQKYSIWILALVFVPAVFALRRRISGSRPCFETAVAALLMLICVAPQLIKNYLWTGNPLAPFAAEYIASKGVFMGHVSDAIHFPWSYWLFLPYYLFFHPDSPHGRVGPFPLFLFVSLLAVLFPASVRNLKNTALTLGLCQLALWVIVRQEDWLAGRFLLAPMAMLLVGAAPIFDHILKRSAFWRIAILASLIAVFAYQGIWLKRHQRAAMHFFLGQLSREAWLARHIEYRAYAPVQWMAERMSAVDRGCVTQSLYYVPPEKVQFLCTEEERLMLQRTPDHLKAANLRARNIRFLLLQGTAPAPGWTKALRTVQVPNVQSSGASWRLYEAPR